ncbi:serine/threonine kinase-1 [Cryptosporidium canis]|nr:serine/threonine kinase-1 [Cryptosporidium canis]
MEQKLKSRNGLTYRNGNNRYTEVIRNDRDHDCLSYDNSMNFVQNRKRCYYDTRRGHLKMRRNDDTMVYNGNHKHFVPEYEYETQYVGSTEKQIDANGTESSGYLNRRYFGNNINNNSNNSEIINNYFENPVHNIMHNRSNKGENINLNGGGNSTYNDYYDYNNSRKRRIGGDTDAMIKNRGIGVAEYRSNDSRGSSLSVYNNHNHNNSHNHHNNNNNNHHNHHHYHHHHYNKKIRYSDDSIENTPSGCLPRDYRNKTYLSSYLNSNTDEIEHFQWYVGQYLTPRYRILDIIGEGTFGRVFECEDLKRKRKVAIKVIRDVQRYTSAAKIEAEILRDINMEDEFGEYSYCVMLYNAFLFNNSNMCLVFEKLGPSLFDFLDGNCSRGFFLADIQNIAEQFLLALSFLRRIKLTHTDLKLENILLTDNNYIWVNAPRHPGTLIRRPVRPEIRLIDFGAATYEHDYHGSVINTRQYRAPEVILDLGWDMSSDMWGFGCILMELYTGALLFKTHEHMEHLAMIERIIEPFPENMLRKAYNLGKSGRKYVDRVKFNNIADKHNQVEYSKVDMGSQDGNNSIVRDEFKYILNWPEGSSSTASIRRVSDCKPLESLVHKKHLMLAKFVRYILRPDPNLRPTPEMALKHEFFKYKFEEEI